MPDKHKARTERIARAIDPQRWAAAGPLIHSSSFLANYGALEAVNGMLALAKRVEAVIDGGGDAEAVARAIDPEVWAAIDHSRATGSRQAETDKVAAETLAAATAVIAAANGDGGDPATALAGWRHPR